MGFDRASEKDLLGRGKFVERIVLSLVNEKRATELVVGLRGDWGSGKSSVLKQVRNGLEAEGCVVFAFNPWMVSDTDNLIQIFLAGLMHATGNVQEDIRKRLKGLQKLAEAVLPDSAKPIKSLMGHFLSEGLEDTYKRYRVYFEEAEAPIVVIIDELDRLLNREIVTLFRLIKAIGDLPNVSYLLAYDKVRVEQALVAENGGNEGAAYLEKIVQLEYSLPYLQPIRANRFLEEQILAVSAGIIDPNSSENSARFAHFLSRTIPQFLKTPRDIKRLVNSWHAKWHSLKNEVDWLDLMGFCLLEIKAPEDFQRISDDPMVVARDGFQGTHTMLRGRTQIDFDVRSDFEAAFDQHGGEKKKLGPSILEQDVKHLVSFLFPSHFRASDVPRAPARLAIEGSGNLLAVLTFGEPDQTVLQEEIARFLASDKEQMKSRIEQWYQQDTLSNFFDRFFETYDHTRVLEPNSFWRNLIHWIENLSREGMEERKYDFFHEFSEKFEHLLRFGDVGELDVGKLITDCIQDGSLEGISCFILREGQAKQEAAASDESVGMPCEQYQFVLESFQTSFIDRVRKQSDRNVNVIRTAFPLFVMANWPVEENGEKKNGLRKSTKVVENGAIKEVFANYRWFERIAFLLFRKNFIASSETCEKILDMDWTKKYLADSQHRYDFAEGQPGELPYEREARLSITKLVATCFPDLCEKLKIERRDYVL